MGTVITAPIHHSPRRLQHRLGQPGKGITVPHSYSEPKPHGKQRSVVRDDTASGPKVPVNLSNGRRTTRSSIDGLGHPSSSSLAKPDLDFVPVQAKLLRRFYEPLVLLHFLDPNRGNRIPRSINNLDCKAELQRSFIDSVAYICDYEKGGDTFTAAAMQKEPAGVTIWLAANTNISEKTVVFLRDVLDSLAAVSFSNRAETEENLGVRIIDFNKKRLRTYQKFVYSPLCRSLGVLEESCNSEYYPQVPSCMPTWHALCVQVRQNINH